MVALGDKESISHAAADDKGIDLIEEVVDDADLVGDLCAAEDSDEGSLRILKSAAHELDFLLDEEAADCRQIVGNAGRGGVSSVSRTESVVYIDIRKGGKSLRECGIVLGLFCVETHVLKEHDFAVLEISGKLFCAVADNILSHLDILTEKLGKSCGYGSKGELGLELTLGSAQMGAKDNLCVMIDKIFDSGEEATILLSEVILPSWSGTLKSQRTSTLLPETSISLTDFLLSALILIVLSKVEFASFLRLHH